MRLSWFCISLGALASGPTSRGYRAIETVATEPSTPVARMFAEACRPSPGTRRACVEVIGARVEEEQACAARFNDRAIREALAKAGLEPVEGDGPSPLGIGDAAAEDDGITLVREVDGETVRSVSLGVVSDACGQPGGPLAWLTRDRQGTLLLVHPRPDPIQRRTYTRCGCVSTCGGDPMPVEEAFADLPPGEELAGTIDLPVPQLSVTVVGSQECPPMP